MPKRKYNDNNKLPQEQYDPKAIWFNANLFLKAAERCGSEGDGHDCEQSLCVRVVYEVHCVDTGD